FSHQMIKLMQNWSLCLNVSIHVKKKLVVNLTKKFSNTAAKLNCQKQPIMKVLNVAEKNDAAKNIAGYLSRGTSRRKEGLSPYNKIYEFQSRLWNKDCQMIMTSVSGHLLNYEFTGAYRKWYGCPPLSLFEAPVVKQCQQDNYEKIKKTIEREVRSCSALIIWTDCDREGENIGFEIIQVCQAVKPNIRVYRAKFSEITQISIDRALQSLEEPNKAISDAVDVRSELDLRIGAAFTRFQTMRLQKAFPRNLADMLISYGPCQFPTLGFVVERFLAIERFEPEPYWKLKVTHLQNELNVEFRWARNRLFEKLPCEVFLDICQENPQATVEKVTAKPKSKWRPLPLDTIELEKQGSRKLRLSAKETMQIAEKLYTGGFISYPRTETNIFPKEMNLSTLVQQQTANGDWGGFAQRVLDEGITPRQGKKSDQAHPPIHPTKFTDTLRGNEARVYEYVVRHFLACLSKNAEGHETIVEIDIAGEKFVATGLQILAKNYLEVFIYEKWNAKEIHIYERGQTFMPTSIEMLEETTSPPNLLTEADLIALMDKHGIGTDATHAEHIETIKSRQYVGLRDNKYLIPGKLGIGLVMGYDRMGFQMSKPHLRAELENDLKLICDGVKTPDEVRQSMINKYREVFREALVKANMIDAALAQYLDEQPEAIEQADIAVPVEDVPILRCPKCNSNMVVKTKRQGNGKYIGCMGYPTCNNVIWLPESVEECPDNILKKIKVRLTRNIFPQFGTSYTACIGGCDDMFNNLMGIRASCVRRGAENNDTGYESNTSSRSNSSSSNTNRPQQRTTTTRPAQQTTTTARPAQQNANHDRNQRGGNNWSNDYSESSWSSGVGSSSTGNQNRPTNSWNNQNSDWSAQNQSSRNNSASTNFNLGNENEGEIMCNCHQVAKQLTVRKEGPNQGRTFYKCAKPAGSDCNFFLWGSEIENGGGAVTAAQRPAPANNSWNQNQNFQNNRQNPPNGRQNNRNAFNASGNWDDGGDWNNDNQQVMCNCGNPAKKLTVSKEGPNKGREFYSCPQGVKSDCNFFQWADSVDGAGGGGGGGYGGGGGGGGYSRGNQNDWGGPPSRGRGGKTRGAGAGPSAPKRPRGAAAGGGTKRKCGVCGVEGHTKRTCPQNSMN
ncbi:hypothetical protein TSAR_001335, partial [Trichomalopsis sarcophagae]